jgi:hypothetical protein
LDRKSYGILFNPWFEVEPLMIFTLKSVVCCLLAIVLTGAVPARAQKDKEADQQKELEKKTLALLNDVAAGAWSLKLPENRLFIMSNAADLLWTVDEKRARTLYWDALNALNLVNGPSRSTEKRLSHEDRAKLAESYLLLFELRQKLLRRVARRDAQLALDMLRSSRPVPPRHVIPEFSFPDDIQLEQAIAVELAARDPAQALQIARQSLAKGLTLELLTFLQRLNDVDSEKGSQFAGEIISKLRTINLSTNFHGALVAAQLLYASRKRDSNQLMRLGGASGVKVVNLEEEQKRSLVEQVTDAVLSASVAPHVLLQLTHVMAEIEHFFPERSDAVAQKLSALQRSMQKNDREQETHNLLMMTGEVEELVRGASTADSATRMSLYHQAAMMAVAHAKTDWFREAINKQETSSDLREQIIDALDYAEIGTAVMRKQIDTLQKLLPKIRRKDQRAGAMAELALLLHEKGEKEEASTMLDEAATLIKTDLTDDKQTNALLTLLCAFAVVDPPKAFALAERTIDRANRQISLLLLLDKVVKSGALKKNELLLEQPQLMPVEFLVFKYGKGVAALARADFNRTRAMAERFDRNELRLMAQLFVLKGLLEPQATQTAMFSF